jgi:hypothetical protein
MPRAEVERTRTPLEIPHLWIRPQSAEVDIRQTRPFQQCPWAEIRSSGTRPDTTISRLPCCADGGKIRLMPRSARRSGTFQGGTVEWCFCVHDFDLAHRSCTPSAEATRPASRLRPGRMKHLCPRSPRPPSCASQRGPLADQSRRIDEPHEERPRPGGWWGWLRPVFAARLSSVSARPFPRPRFQHLHELLPPWHGSLGCVTPCPVLPDVSRVRSKSPLRLSRRPPDNTMPTRPSEFTLF